MTGRERIIGMIRGETTDRLPFMPITMMFAADQIGRPYREYVTDYRVLVDAQLVTAEKFDIDYVSCISDPAREAFDCGASVTFFEDQPPAIDESRVLLADKARLKNLQVPDLYAGGRMHDRLKAAALFREQAAGRLIEGWIEGPCAEAADLRGINTLMMDFFDDPPFVEDLMDFVVEMEIAFAKAQIEAGVDLIGIGDAASSLVGPRLYEQFVWPRQQRLVDAIHGMGALVRLHVCGNTKGNLKGMGQLGCAIVDIDYPVPMEEARGAMAPGQVLLGNIDPVKVLRNGKPEKVRAALQECWEAAGPRYIVGAGCEVPRGTPDENLLAMLEFARAAC